MTQARDRTHFDAESGSIMDLPDEMRTRRGDDVRLLEPGETSVVIESLDGRRQEIIFPAPEQFVLERTVEPAGLNAPGAYAAYRERVEAQFSAPVTRTGDAERAVSVVISGFDGVGKSTVGAIIAHALMDYGIRVCAMGERAASGMGVPDLENGTTKAKKVAWPSEPMTVEIWEIDRASPHNH
jgi:hypothetical protein